MGNFDGGSSQILILFEFPAMAVAPGNREIYNKACQSVRAPRREFVCKFR